MTIKQETEVIEPKSGRGGARLGAGRPRDPSAKNLRKEFFEAINVQQEVVDLQRLWNIFKQQAEAKAYDGNTEDLQWIFSRIIPVPKEQDIDVTSNGQPLSVQVSFTRKELPEYRDIAANDAD